MQKQTAMPARPACPRDFADWLPPILVKELRQGLRTHLFVGLFVMVQVAMILLLGTRLRGGGHRGLQTDLDSFQWMAIGGALLVLLPMRGLAVVSEETRMQTRDLVHLTHMSSLRMVVGKWLALVCQTLLLVTAVLPYQVLYYFFGHVDVVANLEVLGILLAASLLLTALCIALSPASMLVRIAVLGVAGMPLYALSGSYIMRARYGGGMSFSGPPGGSWIWALLFHGLMSTVFLLTVASARVGHLAENAAARMRGVALITLLGILAGTIFAEEFTIPAWVLFGLPLLVWAGVEALTERASPLASTYLPFTRFGQPLIGRLLYPGWGTGVLFVLLITAGLVVAGAVVDARIKSAGSSNVNVSLSMFHLGMAVLFPATLLCVLPRVRQRQWLYVVVQLACGIWFVEISSISFKSEPVRAFFLGCNPLSEIFWVVSHSYNNPSADFDGTKSASQTAAFTVELGMLCWLLVRSRQEFQTIRDGETQARKLLPATPVSPPLTASS